MNRRSRVNSKQSFIILSVVYALANLSLLLLNGNWWDDLTFETHNLQYINAVALQSGRPEWNILIPFCWSLPNNGRILIFFLYYAISLFLLYILVNSTLFTQKQSLIIASLFIIIPVNEARLLISNFSYTTGLFFFFLSLALFIKWNNLNNSIKKNVLRIGVLLLFYISFILNSLLAFYYILFIYLFIIEIRKKNTYNLKNLFISIKTVVIKYFDFFVLPFVYYGINKLFFPTLETFENYNAITIKGLFKCVKYIPLSIINIFKTIIMNMIDCLHYPIIIFMCLAILLVIIIKHNKLEDDRKLNMWILFFGLIILCLGLFPYVEVRGKAISCTGVNGRDAILTPLGIAIILYSLFSIMKGKLKEICLCIFIILGITSLNVLYIEWQKDYYYQLSMENLLENTIIEKNDTFYLADLNETSIKAQRFYSLNVNAYHIYNDESRLFIPKTSDLYMLESKDNMNNAKNAMADAHFMKDYNPDDYNFDAIIIYFCNLDLEETLKLKYYEIFDNNKFNEIINSIGQMEIIEVDDDFTEKLLEEYRNGVINNDDDVINLLMEYNK